MNFQSKDSEGLEGLFGCGSAPGDAKRGWFVGRFLESDAGLRRQDALEIKWGRHPVPETRPGGWVASATATSISILVEGRFTIRLRTPPGKGRKPSEAAIELVEPGDYAMWAPEVEHTWEAIDPSIVVTVRFPSVENDQRTPGGSGE